MRYLSHLVLLIVMVNVTAGLLAELEPSSPVEWVVPQDAIDGYEERTAMALSTMPDSLLDNSVQRGSVTLKANGVRISDSTIARYFSKRSDPERSSTVYWKFRQPDVVSATASAADKHHYFVNSYLIGYQPFKADAFWQPFYTVASRKVYQLDSRQYGLKEIWQNSAQAYRNTRGDCEDHAILLADWLIETGIDARVVLGDYKGGGHAWVVAYMKGEAFLLEATSKRRHRSWNAYPKALLSRHYQPRVMFNRDSFWINTGSRDTRDYSGSHWQVASTFRLRQVPEGL